MIAIVDAHYQPASATGALVLARTWTDPAPISSWTVTVEGAADYEPGAFYKRELPVIMALLARATDPIDVVVVDGYCWLGPDRPGLGARLHEALRGASAVVGVAKSRFAGAEAERVLRGQSRQPLFVTSVGMDVTEAAARVRAMHGPHRIPTLIKEADRLCRS